MQNRENSPHKPDVKSKNCFHFLHKTKSSIEWIIFIGNAFQMDLFEIQIEECIGCVCLCDRAPER